MSEYHKFLVDFKMFAQTEAGEYLPQMPVKPIFDGAYITSLLENYVTEQQQKDAEVAKQIPKVVERIGNEIIKAGETKHSKGRGKNHFPAYINFDGASDEALASLGKLGFSTAESSSFWRSLVDQTNKIGDNKKDFSFTLEAQAIYLRQMVGRRGQS